MKIFTEESVNDVKEFKAYMKKISSNNAQDTDNE